MSLLGEPLNPSMPDLANTADPKNIGTMSANILGREEDKPELISSCCPIQKLRL